MLMILMGGVVYLIYSGKFEVVINQIQSLSVAYLMLGLLAIVAYWITEAKITNEIVRSTGNHQPFNKAMEVTMIGQFFNGITPFASGGQPAQLYLLAKQKLPLGQGSSVLISKFIIYQGVLVVYSLLFIVIRAKFFAGEISNLFYIVVVGFMVNLLVIGSLLFFSFAKKSNLKIVEKFIRILHKIKLVKNPTQKLEKFQNHVKDFHEHTALLKNNNLLFFKVVILSAIQLTFYFVIPYFIYRSLGLQGADLLSFIAGTGFVLMISSFIPIPGASGGAEGGFTLILGLFFLHGGYIITAIVLWRLITYYLGVFIGGLWMVISKAQIE